MFIPSKFVPLLFENVILIGLPKNPTALASRSTRDASRVQYDRIAASLLGKITSSV
jgi:hypothetical protein